MFLNVNFVLLFLLVGNFGGAHQRTTPEDEFYTAAVVEYHPTHDEEQDLHNYIDYIQQASEKDADIIVFPELTLKTKTPVRVPIYDELVSFPIPAFYADLYHPVLVSISSSAAQYQIYVVINIEETINCTLSVNEVCPGSDDRTYNYNSNVVFDRDGKIIDRYRKINLFGEYTRIPSTDRKLGVFDTDFGVRFGHFICFDLLFQVPALQVLQKESITDVIFTTMWFSELPYLTAVGIQEAYAYANNVNFLAAGANDVSVGSAGSGIYSGKNGALTATMPGYNTSILLVATLTKTRNGTNLIKTGHIDNDPKTMGNLYLKQDPSLKYQISQLVEDITDHQVFELKDGNVTCSFSIKLNNVGLIKSNRYRYRATVFDGVRTFSGVTTGGVRICSVVACTNDDVESCGIRFSEYTSDSTPIFDELVIDGDAPAAVVNASLSTDNTVYFISTLDERILPLDVDDYILDDSILSGRYRFKLQLTNRNKNLLCFSVWGRYFPGDGDEETIRTTSSSYVYGASILLLLFVTLILRLYQS